MTGAPMTTSPDPPVRILLVEDDPLDAELILDELRADALAFEARVVDDEGGFDAALDAFAPDLVISDLSLPGFSGYRALERLRARSSVTPFVFVSGTIGEEAAIDALQRGATDYVLKGRLVRLASVVRRALRDANESLARERVEHELLRAQRFESLALLAGGLSHDLRNILQPLLLTADAIAGYDDIELRKHGQLVGDCARRGLEMVASMLSFARGARTGIDMRPAAAPHLPARPALDRDDHGQQGRTEAEQLRAACTARVCGAEAGQRHDEKRMADDRHAAREAQARRCIRPRVAHAAASR